MHEVYKIIGYPKSLFYDGKYGQLVVKDLKNKDVIIHIINDLDGKARSILYLWSYFNSKNKPLPKTFKREMFYNSSVEIQKNESAKIFTLRDKPLEFYINAKYKSLINTTTKSYSPIVITDILNIFDNILNNSGLNDKWIKSDIKNPTWQFTKEYANFEKVNEISGDAVDLHSFSNGSARLEKGTEKIHIICPDLTDGMNNAVKIIYNNNTKTFRNQESSFNQIREYLKDLINNINKKTSTTISSSSLDSILKALFKQATIELGLNKNLYVDDVLLKMKQIAEVKGEQLQNNWENVAREKIRNEWATEMKG